MKETKRALRRYQKKVKFKKRLKIWLSNWDNAERREEEQKAFKGEAWTFLRTTSRPCNCWMCSTYEKYERTPKHKINKQIWDDIQDDLAT